MNVEKLRVTGNKAEDKKYYRHSGYPGGIYETSFAKLKQRFPARVPCSVVGGGGRSSFGYDPLRNQLSVGEPASNRVVLQRRGVATSISIVGDTPDPSIAGQPATFTATITASPTTPTDGQVRFAASSGESCIDTTPTPASPNTVDYSCAIAFTGNGVSTVVAEYTGSVDHAYSGSAPEVHVTKDSVFADGIETP